MSIFSRWDMAISKYSHHQRMTFQGDATTRAHSKSWRETGQALQMDFAQSALGVRCVFASLFSDH
jgi:hypothetical protein